jgi:prolyl-tRNA editing enzyme YbaK/EbsC (Cys-tRNA(Pro) deacylase)
MEETMAKAATTANVKRVQQALKAAGLDDAVVEIKTPIADAGKAARELDVEPGQILQTLVYFIGKRFVLVMIAGDHRVVEASLPPAFFLEGKARKPSASEATGATGFAPGATPPIGLPGKLPAVIDRSLKRFHHVYAAAGDANHAVRIGVPDLIRLTGAIVSYNVAAPLPGVVVAPVEKRRTKTFTGERKLQA